jgi:general stress protein YciG
MSENIKIANRGFASLSKEQRILIASKGGKTISLNRQHMAEIGRKGGEKSRLVRKKNIAIESNQ